MLVAQVQGNGFITSVNQRRMVTLFQESHMRIAAVIKESLPRGTYTNISVTTLNYDFHQRADEQKETRRITLSLSSGEKVSAVMKALLVGIGVMSCPELGEELDEPKLEWELLKTIAGEHPEPVEITKAYKQARTLHLYIAKDLSFSELDVEWAGTTVSYKIGQVVGVVAKLGAIVLPIVEALRK